MNLRGQALGAAAAAALAIPVVSTPAQAAPNPNTPEKMAEAVTVDAVTEHLDAFQAIADANNNTRAAATPGYEASAEYVEETLRKAGYQPERQYFEFEFFSVDSTSFTLADDSAVGHRVMSYSPSTPEGGVTASLVQPAVAIGCEASDWDGVDVTGQVALVSRGTCSFAQKSQVAGAAGAAAVVIYNNGDGELNGTLGGQDDANVPTTGTTRAIGEQLKSVTDPVTLDIQTTLETRETFNIIAETQKGRTDNVVMVGAHLDGAPEGPGINDNGTGSAGILETAVQLSRSRQLNNQVRFAWWGAEELGLLGSWNYIEDLYYNNPSELENIATYLNFDMIGSPNHVIGVYDADQSTYEAPVTVPKGSAETEEVFTDWFDSTGQAWVDTPFSGRSDYQGFIEVGIPASGLFTGADGSKTAEEVELFGGTEGVMYDPNYHTPRDDIDNVNLEALDTMSDTVAAATVSLAQDTSAINGKRSAGKSGKPHPEGDTVINGVERTAS